jgi:translation initiation factor 1
MKNNQHIDENNRIVYSTNRNLVIDSDKNDAPETLAPENQNLRVRVESKGRGGKTATIITGFIGTNDDLKSLEKMLKNHCGTGGSSKDSEILMQGDVKEKIVRFLSEKGYKIK